MNKEYIHFQPLSAQDFQVLGVGQVAYIKSVLEKSKKSSTPSQAFAVFAADGKQVAVLPNEEVAFAAVRQQGLEPVYLQ